MQHGSVSCDDRCQGKCGSKKCPWPHKCQYFHPRTPGRTLRRVHEQGSSWKLTKIPFFLDESDSSTLSQDVSGFFAFTSLMRSFNQPHNVPLVGFVRIVQSLENLHFFPATSNIHSHQAHPNKSPKAFRISHWALDSAAFFIISLERMIFNASNHPVKTIDSVDCFSLKVFFFCGRCRPDATKGSPSVLVSFALTTSIFSPNDSQPRK